LIAAERGTDKIAIEIKTFSNLSFITALYEAVGKYIIYRNVLKMIDSERVLFLAIPESIYIRFFEESIIQKTMQEERFKLVIYNQTTQIITQWIES
jgi:XisH protein